MRHTVGCSLSYNVLSDTVFIFNLEVAQLGTLDIARETLTLTPELRRRTYTARDSFNRHLGVSVPAGAFALEYEAEVELNVHRADPDGIGEMPASELPLDVLPYLLPSRIGVGCDAAEIAFSTPYDNMQPTGMAIRIQRAEGDVSTAPRTIDAISVEAPVV